LRFDFRNEVQCGYFLDRVELEHNLGDERRIRSPKDYKVKIDGVLECVQRRRENLARIECWIDAGLRLSPEELSEKLKELLGDKSDALTIREF
jgi:hypothetical protein